MFKSKVLVGIVLVIYVLSGIFGFMGSDTIAFNLDSSISILLAIIYLVFAERKTTFFTLFLLCYAGSDVMGIIMDPIYNYQQSELIFNLDYFVGNSIYIMAYVFLLAEICKGINGLHVLKHFIVHIIVLLALNIWLAYVLQSIAVPELNNQSEFYLELVYNITMLTLLSVSLLNYFYKDNQKSLYLFLGALCMVFSEVIDVAYIYISQRALLNFLSTTLALLAFYFFCKQIGLSDVKEEEIEVALD